MAKADQIRERYEIYSQHTQSVYFSASQVNTTMMHIWINCELSISLAQPNIHSFRSVDHFHSNYFITIIREYMSCSGGGHWPADLVKIYLCQRSLSTQSSSQFSFARLCRLVILDMILL